MALKKNLFLKQIANKSFQGVDILTYLKIQFFKINKCKSQVINPFLIPINVSQLFKKNTLFKIVGGGD